MNHALTAGLAIKRERELYMILTLRNLAVLQHRRPLTLDSERMPNRRRQFLETALNQAILKAHQRVEKIEQRARQIEASLRKANVGAGWLPQRSYVQSMQRCGNREEPDAPFSHRPARQK